MVPDEDEGASVVGLDAVLDQAADACVHLFAHHWQDAAVAPVPVPAPAPPAPALSAASSTSTSSATRNAAS